jgi:hypothetical protein
MRHTNLIKIEELNQEIKKLRLNLDNEQRENRKTLIPQYTYEVYPHTQKESSLGWSSKIPVGQEYIVIRRYVSNMVIFDDHLEYYGSIMNKPEASVLSVTYYRKHGILLHESGGHLVLNDEQLCSDEEWNDLKNGNLGKFVR